MVHRFATPYHPRGNGLAERKVQTAKQTLFKMTNGNLSRFDETVPFVQLAMNLHLSRLTGSASFSLFFARHFNYGFQPEQEGEKHPMTEEELLQRFQEFQTAVLPAIYNRVSKINDQRAVKFNKANRLISFPEESFVMLKSTGKKTIQTAPWTGPFKVLRKTTGGSYILEALDGSVHPTAAPPSALKTVSAVYDEPSYEIQKIIKH